MSTFAIHSDDRVLIKPEPRSPISIRVAVARDLRFIDDLQKKHSKMVGFARTSELEKHIAAGRALIANLVGTVSTSATSDASQSLGAVLEAVLQLVAE